MSKIAALSAQAPVRPTSAPARAPVAAPAVTIEAEKPQAAQPVAPTLQVAPVAAQALSVLIDLQAKPADPQPSHGNDDQHGHKPPTEAPPPVVQPPAAPPPVVSPPVVEPRPVAPAAPYDAAAPQRAIAMISQRLADEAVQDQARAGFVAERAAERAAVTVSEGRAALAIFQAMQQSYDAWRAAPSLGFSQRA